MIDLGLHAVHDGGAPHLRRLDIGCGCVVWARLLHGPNEPWTIEHRALCGDCATRRRGDRAAARAQCRAEGHVPGEARAGICYWLVRCRRCGVVLDAVDSGD